jgi:hypothetical protein
MDIIASGVIDKHNYIVKCLLLKMKNAGMSCSYDAKNLNRQRQGDIFVPEFDNYRDAYLDVSVINITVKSHLGKSSKGLLMGAVLIVRSVFCAEVQLFLKICVTIYI